MKTIYFKITFDDSSEDAYKGNGQVAEIIENAIRNEMQIELEDEGCITSDWSVELIKEENKKESVQSNREKVMEWWYSLSDNEMWEYAKNIDTPYLMTGRQIENLYFKTTGQEPDVNCVEPCFYNSNNNTNQPYCMIGSGKCQECQFCFGWDKEEQWVKCLNYSLLESKDKNKTLEAMNWWNSLDRIDKIFVCKGRTSVVEITEKQIENIYNEQFNK